VTVLAFACSSLGFQGKRFSRVEGVLVYNSTQVSAGEIGRTLSTVIGLGLDHGERAN